MSIIDKTEELGAAVAAGLISLDEAAHELQQYSDGGLTRYGAADTLTQWRTVRATMHAIRWDAEAGLAECRRQLRSKEG